MHSFTIRVAETQDFVDTLVALKNSLLSYNDNKARQQLEKVKIYHLFYFHDFSKSPHPEVET